MTGYYRKPALALLTDLINRSQGLTAYLKIKASDIVRIAPTGQKGHGAENTEVVLALRHPSPTAVTNCGRTIEPAQAMPSRQISLYYTRVSLETYLRVEYGGNVVVPAIGEDDRIDYEAALKWLGETFQFDTTDAEIVRDDAAAIWRVVFPVDHPVWFEGAPIVLSKANDIRSLIPQQKVNYLTLSDLRTDTPSRPVSQLVPNWKMVPMLRLSDLSFAVPDRELVEFIPNRTLAALTLADLQAI